MPMKVQVREFPPAKLSARIEGRLDGQTYQQCAKVLDSYITEHTRYLSLDLEKLDYISSVGIRLVLALRKKLEGKGGKLVMANLQPQIQQVIDIANVLPSWGIFVNMEEADAYFDKMQRPKENE